jgi:hypothetical protein
LASFWWDMRVLFALMLMPLLIAGCTPGIPVENSFGTTALAPLGNIPPEFAAFNAFDPSINPLLADQYCATSYQPLEQKALGAAPGQLVYAGGRCRTHIPLIGDLSELPAQLW